MIVGSSGLRRRLATPAAAARKPNLDATTPPLQQRIPGTVRPRTQQLPELICRKAFRCVQLPDVPLLFVRADEHGTAEENVAQDLNECPTLGCLERPPPFRTVFQRNTVAWFEEGWESHRTMQCAQFVIYDICATHDQVYCDSFCPPWLVGGRHVLLEGVPRVTDDSVQHGLHKILPRWARPQVGDLRHGVVRGHLLCSGVLRRRLAPLWLLLLLLLLLLLRWRRLLCCC